MTSYTNVFGGANIQPSTVSYAQYGTIAVPFDANIQLTWATSYVDNNNPVALVMDLNPTAGGLIATFPDATEVSVGQTTQINNISAFSVSIYDFAGGLIVTIAAGLTYSVYLRDNSTAAGTWGFLQNGAIAAAAQAGPLAGLGLINLNNQLNINFPGKTLTANYQVLDSDRGSLIVWTGGAGTITLINQLDAFDVSFNNDGTGVLTVQTGDGTFIDAPVRGAANTSLSLNPGESSSFIGVAGNWNSLGYGKDTFFSVNATSIALPNAASLTLTNQQAANLVITFTGALAQNITVNFPATAGQWYLYNNTTNAFTVTVKLTGLGAGVVLPQGEKLIIYSDGTEMYNTPTVSTSTVFADGNAGAPGIAFTSQTSTGFYRISSGLVGFSSAGTQGLTFGGPTPTYALGISAGLEQRYYNIANSQYVGFKAGVLAGNRIWTLPTADTVTNGGIMQSSGSGAGSLLSFSTAAYPSTTTINQILYSSAANTITGLATANNGVLVTSAGGVPSISSTIPNATQLNITALGTIATGVWNGTVITVPFGGTGLATLTTAYGVICAGTTATGALQNTGTGTAGQVLTSNGAGALPTFKAVGIVGTGVVIQSVSTSITVSTASPLALTRGTWTDIPSFAVTITPTANTSRVKITANLAMTGDVIQSSIITVRLVRGATPIGISTDAGLGNRLAGTSVVAYNPSVNSSSTCSFSFTDSPATTGATIYKIQATTFADCNLYINRAVNDGNTTEFVHFISTINAEELS